MSRRNITKYQPLPNSRVVGKVKKTETILVDGYYTKKITRVDEDDIDERGNYTASDYRLDNLLAIGAVDALKECPKLNMGNFETLDELISGLPEVEITQTNKNENNEIKTDE